MPIASIYGVSSMERLKTNGRAAMTKQDLASLEYLVEKAKKFTMTADQVSAQRRSFAYGNSAFENPKITRAMVDEEAERIGL